VLALLAISMTLLIVGASSSPASAQVTSPCTATLSYPVLPAQYSSGTVPLVVPISASCTASYGNQLYATGSAYDVTANTQLGSASTVLTSVNGGVGFTGQLGFDLAPTSPGDSVQVSVSIYSSQGGNLLTATGETVQLGSDAQQIQQVQEVTTTVTQGLYPDTNPTPTAYPSTYPPQPQYQNQYPYQYQNQNYYPSQTHYPSQSIAQKSNNTRLFDYTVIITIIASVIVATAGLVILTRRQQPTWYPVPPPPR